MDQPQCQSWPCTRSISYFSFFPPPCFFSVYIFLIGNWFIMHIELIFHYLCVYLRRPLRRFVTNLTFICNTIRENGGRMLTVFRFFFLFSCITLFLLSGIRLFDIGDNSRPIRLSQQAAQQQHLKNCFCLFPQHDLTIFDVVRKRYLWRRRRRRRRCLCRCHCEN